MKCLACDSILTDFEATRRYESGGFIDLCNHCFHSGVSEQLVVVERPDLAGVETFEEDYFDNEAL